MHVQMKDRLAGGLTAVDAYVVSVCSKACFDRKPRYVDGACQRHPLFKSRFEPVCNMPRGYQEGVPR
jgi:hypothetical protein